MPVAITDKNFGQEVLLSDSLVFVDCYAEWCAPCKALTPLLLELEDKNKKLKLVLLDIDRNPELVKRLKVITIPKVVVFQKGEEITSISGIRSKADYQEVINSF